jgi:hypothetical protein
MYLNQVDLTAASTLFIGPAQPSIPDYALISRLQAMGIRYG